MSPRASSRPRSGGGRLLRTRAAALLAVIAAMFAGPAQAAFPGRPLNLVVPYAKGGAVESMGHVLAERLESELGQEVRVDAVPGGGTVTGAMRVARAAPDGYTLLLASGTTLVLNPLLKPALPYGADDFRVLGLMVEMPLVLVAAPGKRIDSLAALTALAAAGDAQLRYASSGEGGLLHLAAELLQQAAGISLQHVPYATAGAALADVLGGQADVMFDYLPVVGPLAREGRANALAMGSRVRAPLLRRVPTVAETYPGFQAVAWFALAAPKGVPDEAAGVLGRAVDAVLRDDGLRQQLAQMGFLLQQPMDAAALATYLDDERARWRGLARDRGLAPVAGALAAPAQ